MLSWISEPQAWLALFTLTSLEIVLGIDNIIVLTILVGKLPIEERQLGRIFGLTLAMGSRIVLLLCLVWLTHLTTPLFTIFTKTISARDLILILGGLFLIAKSTQEIHQSMEEDHHPRIINNHTKVSFIGVIIQIGLIDIIFSLDSVITAIGLANQVMIMIIAIMISILVMMFAAKLIGEFVDKHPSLKMLALSFLILIGFVLIGEGFGLKIPKGYIYFAMLYALAVELLNMKLRTKKITSAQ